MPSWGSKKIETWYVCKCMYVHHFLCNVCRIFFVIYIYTYTHICIYIHKGPWIMFTPPFSLRILSQRGGTLGYLRWLNIAKIQYTLAYVISNNGGLSIDSLWTLNDLWPPAMAMALPVAYGAPLNHLAEGGWGTVVAQRTAKPPRNVTWWSCILPWMVHV